jgi:hypothetical protein
VTTWPKLYDAELPCLAGFASCFLLGVKDKPAGIDIVSRSRDRNGQIISSCLSDSPRERVIRFRKISINHLARLHVSPLFEQCVPIPQSRPKGPRNVTSDLASLGLLP